MANDSIDAHLITQFSDMMHIKAQQMKSRLRPYVMIRQMNGEDMAYDGLGTVSARELTGRNNPTVFSDIDHNRRKLSKRQFEITLPIDQSDVESMLTDPQGLYAAECTKELERVFDRVCYDAMFASVLTGRSFGTTVTFANDGGATVNATGGLTLAKLLEIKQNFIDNEVGNDMPINVCFGISGDEHTTLLQIATLTSGDYTRQFALEKGELIRAVGMDVLVFGASVSAPLLAVSGGTRTSFALATGGLCVGIARNPQITLKDRPDYVNVKQLQATMVIGAVRTEGKLIQKLTTTDA